MSKFTLQDLKPAESKVKLSCLEKPLELKPFSLAVQLWAMDTFGEDRIKDMFKKMRVGDIANVAHHMLKDKSISLETFFESIQTHDDKIAVVKAVMESVGLSQPVIDKLAQEAEVEGNAPAPIGADITT